MVRFFLCIFNGFSLNFWRNGVIFLEWRAFPCQWPGTGADCEPLIRVREAATYGRSVGRSVAIPLL